MNPTTRPSPHSSLSLALGFAAIAATAAFTSALFATEPAAKNSVVPATSSQFPSTGLSLATAGVSSTPTAAKPDASKDTYYLSDYLSTTIGTVNAQGVIDQIETDAFGAPLAAGRPPVRFTGKPYDEDIGAYIFPFRNYRPDEARWMTPDPSGFPDGVNNRAYAPSPLTETDPDGLNKIALWIFAMPLSGGQDYPSTQSNSGVGTVIAGAQSVEYDNMLSANFGRENLDPALPPIFNIPDGPAGSQGTDAEGHEQDIFAYETISAISDIQTILDNLVNSQTTEVAVWLCAHGEYSSGFPLTHWGAGQYFQIGGDMERESYWRDQMASIFSGLPGPEGGGDILQDFYGCGMGPKHAQVLANSVGPRWAPGTEDFLAVE